MQSFGQTNPQSEDCLFLNIYVPGERRSDSFRIGKNSIEILIVEFLFEFNQQT